jgi:hypothetical protein
MIDKVKEAETPKEDEPKEIDESALFDAVSGAIDEVTITPEKKDDEPTNDDDESGDGDGTEGAEAELDAGGDTGATDDAGNEEDPPGEKPKDKDTPDVDGEIPGDEGGDVPPKKDDELGDDTPSGDDPPPELDPVNDPIPESTNEKTAERIKSLISLVKDKSGSEDQRDEILQQITDTGTDADQYANTLGFLKLYNSTDATQRKQALEVARGLVKELALELGEGSTVTKLSDHEDLSAEVEAGTLSEARALEIAATREADKLRTAKETAAATVTETESTTQQNLATGKDQLDVFETAARADENYAKIRPQFIKLLGPILKRTHPSDWGAAAQEVYDQVKTFVPAETPKPKPKPKNTPIRPKQGAGADGKTTEADDVLGAVDAALANM